jgi:predicted  nucleic acid-binding Zn-ribbon protein
MAEVSAGKLFRRIHHLRCRERDLAAALTALPRQLASLQARHERAKKARAESADHIKHLQVTHRAKETAIKSHTGQVKKLSDQRDAASARDDFEALEREIAHARHQIATLEDEILVLLDEIDTANGKVPELEAAIVRAHTEATAFDTEMTQRKKDLEQSLTDVRRDLAERDIEVPREHVSVYNRIVAGRGPDALAPLDGLSCSACGTTQTGPDAGKVKRFAFVTCTECGCILYLSEKDEKELD